MFKPLINRGLVYGLPLFFAFLAGFLIYVNVRENNRERGIRENKALTAGTITEIDERGYKKRDRVSYTYTFEGRQYAAVRWIHVPEAWKSTLPGQTIPVALDARAPENSLFLVFPLDFEGLNLPYPDSIRLRFPFP
ncbi:hypothetical protein [Chitinophaga sp.]|uniref:hypothetical protein n=1 Tax=Chitinophaga sp. TaxID=1869181 RepID=UPI00262A4720|nr:hypothetical protein [uncultured Chitinophaga sp.]